MKFLFILLLLFFSNCTLLNIFSNNRKNKTYKDLPNYNIRYGHSMQECDYVKSFCEEKMDESIPGKKSPNGNSQEYHVFKPQFQEFFSPSYHCTCKYPDYY